jgi:undecaprenyl diphosphate synthase
MNPDQIPVHVAVIMDGNGRWAKSRGLPRIRGHQVGVERVEDIIKCAPDLGIKYLTLYAFSKENWKRPQEEVSFLMDLLARFLDQKLEEMKRQKPKRRQK